MRHEPKDLWMQAMAGGLKAAFVDEMIGYKTIHGVDPHHFLIPKWMYIISRICLAEYEKPMFAGIPLVAHDSERVMAHGQFLPEGLPIPDDQIITLEQLECITFRERMARLEELDDAQPPR